MIRRSLRRATLVLSFTIATVLLLQIAGCGGGGNSTTASNTNPGATPSPTPGATPSPTPAATPTPDPATAAGYLTWKNDNGRTGIQSKETILTPANVNPTQFGELFSAPVDGWIYAQPLYVPHLTIGGAQHNVVFVATEHDTVYAFDADTAGPPLWQKSFLGTGITTVQTAGNPDIPVQPEVGITATPVIDANAGTIYVLAQTFDDESSFPSKLHALDITTGAERPGSPVELADPAFDGEREFARSALLLANGNVHASFASYGDIDPYHGFMFAFNASTLAQVGVWNVTPRWH